MAYQRTKFERIQPVLDKLEEVRPGEIHFLELDPADIASVRHLLYSYFHLVKWKPYFKICTEHNGLLIKRYKVVEAAKLKTILADGDTEVIQKFVLDELLDIPTTHEEDAMAKIRENLPEKLWEDALIEWRRICGNDNTKECNYIIE